MVGVVRTATGIVAVVSGAATAFLAAYLEVASQADPVRKYFVLAIACLSILAVVSGIVFAVAEYFRDRERDARDATRDNEMRQLLELVSRSQASSPTPTPSVSVSSATTLQQAGLDLASEIRGFLISIPSGLSLEDEHTAMFEPFLTRFWPRLHAIKDRLANVPSAWPVISSVEWLPTNRENVQRTAAALERESLRVQPNVPLQ